MAVTTAISQQKWLWYRKKDQRLLDMDIFNQASRSAWGSLVLVFILVFKERKWYARSSFGIPSICISFIRLTFVKVARHFRKHYCSFILLVSIRRAASHSDSYTHLVGSFERCHGSTHAVFQRSYAYITLYIARAQSYVLTLADMADSRVGFSEPLTRASTLGIISPNGKPNLQPICPTGRCTWPSFSSVGICSRCVNIAVQAKLHQHCNNDESFLIYGALFNYLIQGP